LKLDKDLPPMDEIKLLILQSIRKSDLFETEWIREFTAIIMDMYIDKCDGLEIFVNHYEPSIYDFEDYFQDTLIDMLKKEDYEEFKNGFGE
jgi:hypothetical protein